MHLQSLPHIEEYGHIYACVPGMRETWLSPAINFYCPEDAKIPALQATACYYKEKKDCQVKLCGKFIERVYFERGLHITLEDGTAASIIPSQDHPLLTIYLQSPESESAISDMFEQIDYVLYSCCHNNA